MSSAADPQAASGDSDRLRDAHEPQWMLNKLVLFAILLLAAAVRFYALDASSLWNDEGTTWALLARSFPDIARNAAADIHPPGYYWLLKLWTSAVGTSAWVMRSFSALLGVVLVFFVYKIGEYLDDAQTSLRLTALLAALIAAVNPFQLYYSQEARMYMLLAVAAAGLFWALFALVGRETQNRSALTPLAWYIVGGTVGMWTHYSFPIVLAAAFVAYLVQLARESASPIAPKSERLLRFAMANLAILLLYLPWLPTAVRRVFTWPKGGEYTSILDGLALTLQTLITGPIRTAPELAWPWLLIAMLLPLLGLWSLRTYFSALALGLWWLSPVLLMFALGLFSDAFTKFLLAASPAWCLLVAASTGVHKRLERPLQALLAACAIVVALVILPSYYADPLARDNYAGVARYLAVVGDPEDDVVVINAPGQQDVWSYYDPGLRTLPIPLRRPPVQEETSARLSDALTGHRHAYALFWATNESDPQRFVEDWLDRNAYKGSESWQGNLRFVIYTLNNDQQCRDFAEPVYFGNAISLVGQCQPSHPQQASPGAAATLSLRWQTDAPLDDAYKVSVQLLDARDQVIAQHDSAPGGGSMPTTSWQPGNIIVDNHGLPIPVGAPPGDYRLIVALYSEETGERLVVDSIDHLTIGDIKIVRPAQSLPIALIPIQHRTNQQLGPVRLIGYEAYAKGRSHAPETPLQQGDLAHFTFIWQTPDPLPEAWPQDASFTLSLGEQTITSPLAGAAYPTANWKAGDIIRGEFDIRYEGGSNHPVLSIEGDRLKLAPLPVD